VPPPDYTYEKGLGYSAGEDDYGKILKSICDNAIGITVSQLKVLYKYFGVFRANKTDGHASFFIVCRILKA